MGYTGIALLLFFNLAFGTIGYSQVQTSVTLSNPWINRAKQVNQDRKAYRQYYSDSLKQFKKLDKYYKAKLDSMAEAIQVQQHIKLSPQDASTLRTLKKLHSEYKTTYDSLSTIEKPLDEQTTELHTLYEQKTDSVKTAITQLTKQYGTQVLTPYTPTHLDSLLAMENDLKLLSTDSAKHHPNTQDSLPTGQAGLLIQRQKHLQQQTEAYLESYAKTIGGVDQIQVEQQHMLAEQKSLLAEKERLEAYKADFNKYRDKKNLKNTLENLSKSEVLQKNETLNNAHKTLAAYKRKYLTLPSSKDLESGTKRTSLKGKSFWERIKVGGNLRINQQEFLNIDFAPSIAYRIDKRWSVGTAFVYRGQFGNDNKWYDAFQSNTYGYRIFTDYTVYKSFFAHAEFEHIYTQTGGQQPHLQQASGRQSETILTQSVPGAMAGIGKAFGLGRHVKGKVLIQYNFIYRSSNPLYTSPWVVRFGFDIKALKRNQE